jgi:Tfp pilus assembly protein PilF
MSERLEKLQQMLVKSPADTFLLYAIAHEHKKAGDYPAALDYFSRVLKQDPGYCVAYHQAALAYEAAGDVEAAKKWYRDGIAAAQKKGDLHAAEEMVAALAMIE